MLSVIQTRIDAKTRKRAEDIVGRMGMNLSDAIRIFIYQVINDRALPFKPCIREDSTEELKKDLIEAEKDIRNGRLPSFNDVGALMSYLNEE